MVKFGEMATHISKRVEPSETDLVVYVGLEHLNPDSLRIKRHGVPSDVDGQKLLVKKARLFSANAELISANWVWLIGIVFVRHMQWSWRPIQK